MSPKLVFALLVSVIGVAGLAACGDDDDSEEPSPQPRTDPSAPITVAAGEPILIGVSAPVTGPDAATGIEVRDAVVAAVQAWSEENGDEINGHEIEVRAEDDGCTLEDVAESAATRLVSIPGLAGVLGPMCSQGAIAAIPVYDQGGIVAISGSATSTSLTAEQGEGGFFFRTAYRNDLQGALIGVFAAIQLAGESAYIVDDGEDYGQNLAEFAQQALEANDVTVTRETVERGAVDFTPIAQEIAATDAGFVGFAGFNPEAALFYRQLRDAGFEGQFGAGDAVASIRDFVEPVGADEAEGVVFSACPLPLSDDLLSEFEDIHGSEPEASAFLAQYIDATAALLDAIARTAEEQPDGSLIIDPIALRDAVRNTDSEGVSGQVLFDSDGDRVPEAGADADDLVERVIETSDLTVFSRLGLVPCQVQNGELVNAPGVEPAATE